MNRKHILTILSILLLLPWGGYGAKTKKAVFIIVDGVPADMIERLKPPAIGRIAAEGGYSRAYCGGIAGTYCETPTISAVGYNCILTSAWANKHNVWDNSPKPDYSYWSIFRIAKEQKRDVTTALYSSWTDNRTVLLGEGLPETGGLRIDYVVDGFDLDQKNYPKEIDRLCTRFQADQLAYQNERDRIVSMRFYLAGIIVSVLFLIFLLVLGWKKIFRLKRSQMRQEAMKEKAVQAIQRKNMFLSNMSHEVRTPLNAIVGFSAVLTDEDESFDDESRREFSEIIKVNSFQLLKLINDILDFSDFENDNITFNIRTHDAVKLCNEVVETVMASRKLEVEMRFDTDLSVLMLDTDDARLRQVLINLLVNATKFTEQGSIVLELKMADAGTALFSVTDTGCGIPPEKQHLIFERFEKLNDFVQGSGLGLSICQLIVKYMNGKLWVDSGYTRGARFCFTHPLKYNPALHGGTAQ